MFISIGEFGGLVNPIDFSSDKLDIPVNHFGQELGLYSLSLALLQTLSSLLLLSAILVSNIHGFLGF